MIAFRMATLCIVTCLLPATAAAAQTLSTEVERAARDVLTQQASANALVEPEFDLTVVTARAAPSCQGKLAIEAIDTRQPARMRFVARCPDGRGWRHDVLVRARVSAQVVVAAAPVAANAPLTLTDVALERRDISAIPDALGDLGAVVGQTSRRSLRAGDIVRATQLAAPVVVRRGDPVTMVARTDGVEVSMAGEALDAGARGAIVRVRNLASGQQVRMRVAGPGTVQPVEQPLDQ